MSEITIPIPARLKNKSIGGHVCGVEDVYDDARNKSQKQLNDEFLQALQNVITVDPIPTELSNNPVSSNGVYEALNEKMDADAEPVNLGFFYGTCNDGAAVENKTVSASNFILKQYGVVVIYFKSAINTNDTTLNIGSTGSYPIYLNNNKLSAFIVRPATTLTLMYVNEKYNIINYEGTSSYSPSTDWVDLGLPSGLRWAKSNIDVTTQNKFAANAEDSGSYFSWGNADGHAKTGDDYVFNGENYVTTPGYSVGGDLEYHFDAAKALLGGNWRMPSQDDYTELLNNCDFEYIEEGDTKGYLLTSRINEESIFFPRTGMKQNSKNVTYDIGGADKSIYWTKTKVSNGGGGRNFTQSSSANAGYNRVYGAVIRAVQ